MKRYLRAALWTTCALAYLSCTQDLPPALGDPIPDARFEVLNPAGTDWSVGQEIALSDLAGSPVILDFWATWCVPCIGQHDYLMGLKEQYGAQLRILGILREDLPENVPAWLEEHGSGYPIVQAVDESLADLFWINGLPHFVMLTPDRRLSWDMAGNVSRMLGDSVAVRLESMVGEASTTPSP